MITDRELLELAARAAGELTPSWYGNQSYMEGVLSRWNPLTDDGDALRLAVKLGMVIDARHTTLEGMRYNRVEYWGAPVRSRHISFGDTEADFDAATRRAITRAAAAIGESMP